ncbi:MAG TPA: hypothetical protein VJH03_07260 [Blastocatellia bacterium]|nr:hypothetical protein [Blastocatellia bacterium]
MSDRPTKRSPSGDDDEDRLARLEQRMDKLIEVVQGMNTEFRAELRGVKTRLEDLEKTVTERSYDTKPIWERALVEIAETRSELAELRAEIGSELAAVRAEMSEMRTEMRDGFRKFNKQVELLGKDVLDVRTDERLIERRLDDIESNIS